MNFSDDQPKLNWTIGKPLTKGANKGKGHVKIVITFIERVDGVKRWPQRPYKTGVFCNPKDFAVVIDWSNNKVATSALDTRAALKPIKARVESILEHVKTQKQFEIHYLSGYAMDALAPHFNIKIEELGTAKPRPKISSAENYTTAIGSFQEYFGKNVTFDMCTPEALQGYEDWYVSKKFKNGKTRSLTAVGFNMRCLRHVFKRVIRKGIVPARIYPFGEGEGLYTIPEGGDDTKQFMETKEKDFFVGWRHEDDRLNELHDYMLFSYYGFGINMSDVARLRKNEVFKTYISKDRQKTKGKTKKKIKKLIIPMHQVMAEVIKRRGKKSLIPDDYVFPILDYKMEEEAIFYRIRQLVDDCNDVLAMIAKDGKFEIKPTSYTLRHTFAWHFMQQGGTTEELQDAFAHGTKQTTENYQHGFALEKKKKYSQGL